LMLRQLAANQAYYICQLYLDNGREHICKAVENMKTAVN
jgi:hypothetical protein